MKKFQTMAYVVALALVGTAGLTSCSNEEPGDGNYNGETVKTEFAIALPYQNSGSAVSGPSRMPGAIVQDGVPADMTNFQGITAIKLVPFAKQAAAGAIAAGDNRLGSIISLTGDVSSSDASKPSAAKVYSNVSIPLSTASFLFYGKSAATDADLFKIGSLSDHMDEADPANIHFDLDPICATFPTFMGAEEIGGKLLTYLTSVASASDGLGTPKLWYEYTAGDDAAITAMFATYSAMHGLSSFEVERVLTDLYVSLKPLTTPIATSIKTAIDNATYIDHDKLANNDKVVLISTLQDFPQSLNLPVGCVDMKWDNVNHKFVEGDYNNMTRPAYYVYPAQLWYYVNSTIKTSNTSKQTMYNNTNDWATILNAHTAAASVNTNTRAVAIKDKVQYAVGRLDVAIQLDAASLADNSETAEGIATAVNCASGFPVMAVFVGGQKQVGFDFTPKGTTEFTIYDSLLNSATMKAINGSLSAKNHTLVLESTASADVNIAIEMVNTTGVDFYGVDNMLIPKGGRFYVVAKLLAASATETSNKVFKQDYITTANLTLKSLKNAYSTLPDLRTPQLELGFSVDLTWQNGHTYNVDIE